MAKITINGAAETASGLEGVFASRGWASNVMKILALSPEALRQFAGLGEFAKYRSSLSSLERELVISATVRSVEYGWAHHAPLAILAGATPKQMSELKDGAISAEFPPAHQALCRFVLAFAGGKGVSQELMDSLQRHYTPSQVIDIAVTSGYFLAVGALVGAFEIEIEDDEQFALEQKWEEEKHRAEQRI